LIDPRSRQVYPDWFYEKFLRAYDQPAVFEELVERYGVGHTLFQRSSKMTQGLIQYLNQSPHWKLEFVDPLCVIHSRVDFAGAKSR
jgi:hypothetical protein